MQSIGLILLLVLLPALVAGGEVYQCTAADGSKSFQATPCPKDATVNAGILGDASTSFINFDDDAPPWWPAASARDDADPGVARCRKNVEKNYATVPKEIEDLYRKRKRMCHENFHDGSFQIKNCLAEQADVRANKYKELERQKEQSLAYCEP